MRRNIPKLILAILFSAGILTALSINLYAEAGRVLAGTGKTGESLQEEGLSAAGYAETGKTAAEAGTAETGNTAAAAADSAWEEPEEESADGIVPEQAFVDLNGAMAEKLGMKGFFSDLDLYVTESGYIVKAYPYTSTDHEFEQVMGLKGFLSEHGINFLYVNLPGKYLEDQTLLTEFGTETYLNENADRLMKRLREGGVPVLDLRDEMLEKDMDITQMYYKTDHHWNVPTALWAASRIAGALNANFGYQVDLSLYDSSAFTKRMWEECWLGEQGRKIGRSFVGLDDYTEMYPSYETSYTFIRRGESWENNFMGFINEKVYDTEADVYKTKSWHYSYDDYHVINHNVENGSVLIIGDSFMSPCEPILSLGFHETDSICLRNEKEDFDLRSFILDSGCDTVILAYVESMIGSGDDPGNANYRMFDLD